MAQAKLLSSISILALSVLVDRYYYQEWTFPPLRFLYFNIAQSLAIFYGRNDWHYYLTQGYPLLLTTALPFAVIGLYQTLRNSPQSSATPLPLSATVPYVLSATALIVPSTLSFISHKEVRFIYPLLPLLHIIASPPIATFFRGSSPPKRLLLISLLLTNFFIAFFATVLHQPAPITILAYLRTQHTAHYLSQPPSYALSPAPSTMTVGFLTPCHSTPWRSHLIYPGIKAWALTCNPPLNLNSSERGIYLDEADAFYANPSGFLNTHLGPPIKSPLIGRAPHSPVVLDQGWDGKEGRKRWPEYLVFFAQLEPEMRGLLRGSAYTECWREWNSYGHDDWRRRGDLVVWCLNGREGKKKAKRKGRTASG